MAEIERMLLEVRVWRRHYALARSSAPIGSGLRRDHWIEALACSVRERALADALAAVKRERAG